MTKKNRVATIVAACIVIAAGVTGSVYAAVTVAHDKEEAESSTVVTTEAETSTEATTEAVTAATTEVVTTTSATTTTTTAPVTQPETTTESTTVDITGKMTREQFEQIELGMTPEEVIAIVGSQPAKIMENNGKTAYSWVAYDPRSTYPDPYSEIVFENGVVVSWMFIAPIKW